MKRIKRPALCWIIAGIVFSLLTLTVITYGINSTPAIAMDPSVVVEAAQKTLDCVRSGDYDALGQMLYGAPKLGESPLAADDLENTILLAFLNSIQYEISPQHQASDAGIFLNVHINCLDIPALSSSLQTIVPGLMNQIAASKSSESEIYDANRNYQESFLSEVLSTATKQALAKNPQTTDRDITLQLVLSNGRWQVVPTEDFVQLLTGYVSQ